MVERQELYCHNCGKYVQFDIDMDLDGNHVLECPNCGHEHCRVVKGGIITEDRWDSRNQTYRVGCHTITITPLSTYTSYSRNSTTAPYTSSNSASNYFLYTGWMNTTTNN